MVIVMEVRGKETHVKQTPQRKQNLLRPYRCFWIMLKVRLRTKVKFFI